MALSWAIARADVGRRAVGIDGPDASGIAVTTTAQKLHKWRNGKAESTIIYGNRTDLTVGQRAMGAGTAKFQIHGRGGCILEFQVSTLPLLWQNKLRQAG